MDILISKVKRICVLISQPSTLYKKLVYKLPKGAVRNLLLRFPSKEFIKNELKNIIDGSSGKKIFIFPSPACPWGYMFQRPQQMARALVQHGHIVIYMVDGSFPHSPDWQVRGLMPIEPNLYLYNDNQDGDILLKQICYIENCVIWQYWPHQSPFVKRISEVNSKCTKIYDCIDHLTTFIRYSNIQLDFEQSLLKADIVLATARNIRDEILALRNDCLLVPNGVRREDFQNSLIQAHNPFERKEGAIVGYYGAIADWFDFEILDYVAKKNPEWTFILIGEVYPSVKHKAQTLSKNNNVKIMPRVSYSEIPNILSRFDIAILPFLINNITISTSPVKIFEYIAGGKIPVSTPLPEIRNLPIVKFAKEADEFNNQLHEAYQEKDDPQIKKALFKLSEEHTWYSLADRVLKQIGKDCKVVNTYNDK